MTKKINIIEGENEQIVFLPVNLKLLRELKDTSNDYTQFFRNQKPAIAIEDSITDEWIYCLEDGKPVKMLEPYLRKKYNMKFDFYCKRWGLPYNYPKTPKVYHEKRSNAAIRHGLGKKKEDQPDHKRGRKKKVQELNLNNA
jgi:predicted transcriptional regulator